MSRWKRRSCPSSSSRTRACSSSFAAFSTSRPSGESSWIVADVSGTRTSQVLFRGVSDLQITLIQGRSEAPAYLHSNERPLPDAVRVRMTLQGYGQVEQVFLVTGA